MTVNLKIGMRAVTRAGERHGPVKVNSISEYPFQVGGRGYKSHGQWNLGSKYHLDIIAAGYLWKDLGAKPGDTAICVFSGYHPNYFDWSEFTVGDPSDIEGHPESLYIIVKKDDKIVEPEWEDNWTLSFEHKHIQKDHQTQTVNNKTYIRYPKRPEVESTTLVRYGKTIKITSTNGVVTAEVIK